ncbi:MAG: CDP-alcohol phosphatidyltransferase family protein, partial [Candidatus Micrarchaeota archaeon]
MIKGNFSGFSERVGIKLGMFFSKIPLTPNQWTVLSIVPAIFGFVSLAYWKRMDYALFSFAVSALIDGIDGGVARVTGSVSNIGAYLDGMIDRLVEGLLLFG